MRRVLAAACVAALAAGCSLVTSFDGFTGGDTAPDAETPDGAGSDARPGDATGSEAGPAGDASTDTTSSDARGDATSAPITFVQVATAAPSGSVTTATATFAQAQHAGDLVVLAIGWGSTSSTTITAVGDSVGNGYTAAVGPTHISAGVAQSIYYAKAIATADAGANAVTVTFAAAASPVALHAVEYAGLDESAPFDTAAGFGGRSTSANSGPVTTATGRELVFGAGMTQGSFTGAGSLFTLRNLAGGGTSVVEDLVVGSTGSYSADAPIASTAYYVMQVATFR
jgi:hypothetical protein